MQKTALDIVHKAYEALRIKSEADTNFPAERANYGFELLQAMMDQWRLDTSLGQYWEALSHCTIVPQQDTYTVGGAGCDLVTGDERPEAILRSWVDSGSVTYPMNQVPGIEYFRAPRNKNSSTSHPYTFFYSQSYPEGSITLWPAPSTPYDLYIQYVSPLSIPASLSTVMVYGPGYTQALIYGLAQLLKLTYNVQAPDIDAAASQFKQAIRMSRKRIVPSALLDPAISVKGSAGQSNASLRGPLYDITSNSFVGNL